MKRRKPPVMVKCKDCDHVREVAPWQARIFVRCKPCAGRVTSLNAHARDPLLRTRMMRGQEKWRSDNPDIVSQIGKTARAAVSKESVAAGRKKQQETIKNDPVRYAAYCEKRKTIALAFHAGMTDDERQDHYSKIFKNKPVSRAENDFFDVLISKGIALQRQACISGFFVDGFDPDTKVAVEFYGDSHHCNPNKFKDPNQYCSWISKTVQEQWTRDRRRLGCLYKNGCVVVIVWHSEWIKNQTWQIERILNALRKRRDNRNE